jgi:CheY-like chemotaxis protein
MKYTEKGSVAFGYRIKKEEIEFYIADTGIGIQQSEFKNIFDHFHKIDDPDSHYYRGAGIGLSICKSLVELMGGKIYLESKPGIGSTFYFTLPISCRIDSVNRKKGAPTDQKIKSLEKYNILIAEDDPTNYFLMEKILKKTYARLTWAKTGQEAVDYVLKNKNPQDIIILMDIKMPDMDGKEAFKLIRKLHPSIPVMAITAYAHQKEQKELIQLNFDDYLIKPIKKEDLLSAVQKLAKRT